MSPAPEQVKYGESLLVIVGAGASFDSLKEGISKDEAAMPPLTKNLVQRSTIGMALTTRYWQAQSLIDELRSSLSVSPENGSSSASTTLESALQEYLTRQYDPNVPRHIAAMRFYFRDLLWESANYVRGMDGGITNFTGLVRRCYQWAAANNTRVCFVNFNYDPLLEYACKSHFGHEPSQLGTYVDDPIASVLKPHGSVLWSWRHPLLDVLFHPNDPPMDSISAGEPTFALDGAIYCSTGPSDLVSLEHGHDIPALPALALPMAGKSEFVWPPEQDAVLRKNFPNGSFGRVAVVGWRAAESHFTELLQRLVPANARVMVVTAGSPDSAAADGAETIANLGECASRADVLVVPSGFSSLGNVEWNWVLG